MPMYWIYSNGFLSSACCGEVGRMLCGGGEPKRGFGAHYAGRKTLWLYRAPRLARRPLPARPAAGCPRPVLFRADTVRMQTLRERVMPSNATGRDWFSPARGNACACKSVMLDREIHVWCTLRPAGPDFRWVGAGERAPARVSGTFSAF